MAYYGWVVKRMYFDEPVVQGKLAEPRLLVAVLLVSTAIIVAVGLYPAPILNYLLQVANYLIPAG
jgi:NADH:ubiquinone oxidoreductase subunit 2 (subunit N)